MRPRSYNMRGLPSPPLAPWCAIYYKCRYKYQKARGYTERQKYRYLGGFEFCVEAEKAYRRRSGRVFL